MVKLTDISRFNTPQRPQGGLISDRFKNKMDGLNQGRGLYDDKLLLTEANTLQIEGFRKTHYYFHRDLAAQDASPEEQQTLLRRVRRAIYSDQLGNQQNQNINATLDDWESKNPPDIKHPFYKMHPEGISAMSIDTLREDSPSVEMLFQGLEFIKKHEAEVKAILKRNYTMDDAFMIGQDIKALAWIEELRNKAEQPRQIDQEADKKGLGLLRQGVRVMPAQMQELYRKLEIPFAFQNPKPSQMGISFNVNGGIRVTPSDKKIVGDPINYRFIAGHELCHQLMGHDFVRDGFRYHHSNDFSPPTDIAEAAKEFQTRMDRLIARDPAIIKEWQESYGGNLDVLGTVRFTLLTLKDKHQNNSLKVQYESRGHGWAYEQVCNYFGLRQAVFEDKPDIMKFLSPKAAALCDKMVEGTKLQQEQIRDINNYYSNPERDALFALVQADNPLITLPQGRVKT